VKRDRFCNNVDERFFALWGNGIIHDRDKEDNRLGFDSQDVEELVQSRFCHLCYIPDVLSKKSGEVG